MTDARRRRLVLLGAALLWLGGLMATKFFLRATQVPGHGVAGRFDALTTAGASTTTAVVNTAASGTDIQVTKTAAGQVLEWITPAFAADVTILTTDTITFNLWMFESATAANAGARVHLYRYSSQTGTLTELSGSPWSKGTELPTSATPVQNWTGTLSANTTFYTNDRLVIRAYITNAGGTMGSGRTCTLDYDGGSAGADGDSWVQLNNTVSLAGETIPGFLYKDDALPTTGWAAAPGHPLAPHAAWFLGDHVSATTNARVVDRCGGRHGKVHPNTSLVSMKRQAMGLWFRTCSEWVDLADSQYVPLNDVTIVLACRLLVDDQPIDRFLLNVGTFVASTDIMAIVNASDNTNNARLIFRWGGNAPGTTRLDATGVDLTKDSVLAFTVGKRGMEIWQNGLMLASQSGNANRVSAAGSSWGVGDIASGNMSAIGLYGYVGLYKRQLAHSDLVQVTRVPF